MKWFTNVKRVVLSLRRRRSKMDKDQRRTPRIQIKALRKIFFRPQDPSLGKKMIVLNVSTTGIGLKPPSSFALIEEGEEIVGTLESRNKKINVTLLPVHKSAHFIGCAFVKPSIELQNWISLYFDVELAAMKLVGISPSHLSQKSTPGEEVRWFFGKENCELYYVHRQNALNHFHLSFFGNYFEGGANLPVRFGYLIEDLEIQRFKRSSMIRLMTKIPPDLLNKAIHFVEAIEDLDPHIRGEIVRHLKSLPGEL